MPLSSGRAATEWASPSPTPRPKTIPGGSERTLRAKAPIRTPAINPLTVEPVTIAAICGAEGRDDACQPVPRLVLRL